MSLKDSIKRDRINYKAINMDNSDYQGMNYYANKELKTGYKMGKNDIYYDQTLNPKDKQTTIRHELIERKIMSKGVKYKEAHKIANKYEKV
jgi:hypothetical protein